jgi:hypothetical protein
VIQKNETNIWKTHFIIDTFAPDCFSIHQPLFGCITSYRCLLSKG